MIEIVARVKNGLPVIARGTIWTSDDIDYDLFWTTGSPFGLSRSRKRTTSDNLRGHPGAREPGSGSVGVDDERPYVFRATRVCVECRAEFRAIITLAETAGIVWWRCEPKHCSGPV